MSRSQDGLPASVPQGLKSLARRDWCRSNLESSQWRQARNSYNGDFTHTIFEFYDPHLAAEFAPRFC